MTTYALGRRRALPFHVVGSTAFFLVAVVGVAGGVACAGGSVAVGNRVFAGALDDVRFPTPEGDGSGLG